MMVEGLKEKLMVELVRNGEAFSINMNSRYGALRLFNVDGILVFSETVSVENYRFDFSHIPNGTYLLQAEVNRNLINRRIDLE